METGLQSCPESGVGHRVEFNLDWHTLAQSAQEGEFHSCFCETMHTKLKKKYALLLTCFTFNICFIMGIFTDKENIVPVYQ